MNRVRPHQQRRLGSLVILLYLAGGLGPASEVAADLLRGEHQDHERFACGCAEASTCCRAACCLPTPAAPSCCETPGAAQDPAGDSVAVAVAPATRLAFVAGCTCGQRNHQGFPSSTRHEQHLSVGIRAGTPPPVFTRLTEAPRLVATSRRPEPRDRVPKAPVA